MVVHFPAAPHDVAQILELIAVAGAAGQVALLQNVDVLTFHLAVPHQIAGGGQGRKAAAHDIGGFLIHALRLLGAGKRFIITTGIIHSKTSCKFIALCFLLDEESIHR